MGRMRRWRRLGARRGAAIATGALVIALAALVIGVYVAGPNRPTAQSCGSPKTAHTAPIAADPSIACFRQAAAACTARELDVPGLMTDSTVDEHFIVTPSDQCRVDDYVTHYLNNIPNTSLDFQCTGFAQLPDWGLVLTGCLPPVQCYATLGSPVIDPPAVSTGAASPSASPALRPAGPGRPAVDGQPHC